MKFNRLVPNQKVDMDVTRSRFAVLRTDQDARWRNVYKRIRRIDRLQVLELQRRNR